MKTKKSNQRLKYVNIRFQGQTEISHDFLKKTFGYESDFVKTKKDCGFKTSNMRDLINEIINNMDGSLVSVAEDNTSISYHFILNAE